MPMHRTNMRCFISLTSCCLMLTGCMLGPDFHQPDAPVAQSYTASQLPKKTTSIRAIKNGGQAQYYVSNLDIPAEWWALFHSPDIDHLMRLGIAHSPNITAARAALHQSQEILNEQIGNSLFPAFSAQLAGERQQSAAASTGDLVPSDLYNLFNASINVTYTLDVFGGARREIESLQAQVNYQQFQLLAAYLTLTANIATTAITSASLEEQIKTTEQLIHIQEDILHILNQQYRFGGISRINVLTQETQLQQTRATLPPLEKSLSQSNHALAVLIGEFPNHPMPSIHLNSLHLPTHLPVSLPSNLVRQRPDVRASIALLHAASAQIGVATANLFPQFAITGTYGRIATTPALLFNPTTKTWTIGGQITQSIFQGGALLAARRAAIAAYDQSAAQYQQTVLQAFQNVADTLRALETDAHTLRDEKLAEIAAYENLKLSRQQYRLGGVNFLNLLTVEQQYQQATISRIQAQATRYNDTVALFQALGGGWWNRQTKTCDTVNPMQANLRCP